MQEENFTMEKKIVPRQQPSSSSTDRKTELSSRSNYGRKRWKENGSTPTAKAAESLPAPSRSAQKWSKGNTDKRPRQRGNFGNRQREEIADPDDALEVFSTRSRKLNANELLRFHFSPRQTESSSHGRWSGRGGGGNHGHYRPRKTARYNKEQFLQASCQFVVRSDGQYGQQAMDPDALVHWDMIQLVRITSPEPVTCPICLQAPFAGQITKCGHIFCWACMIRYLTLGEKDYRKCPICYDAVKTEDLKSVQWVEVPDFKVGDSIEMKLMRKSKGSVYVAPKPDWKERNGVPLNFQDGKNTRFVKLLVAEPQQIQREVLAVEAEQLQAQMAVSEPDETPFIDMAKELLAIREKILKECCPSLKMNPEQQTKEQQAPVAEEQLSPAEAAAAEPNSSTDKKVDTYADAFEDELESVSDGGCELSRSLSEEAQMVFPLDQAAVEDENDGVSVLSPLSPPFVPKERERQISVSSEGSLPIVGSPVHPYPPPQQLPVSQSSSPEEVHDQLELPPGEAAEPPPRAPRPRPQQQQHKNTYYFYQAASGQNIYLHSVNARCLQQEYGSLEDCPLDLSAKIVAIKRMFMTEDVRKRLRYLNHIPLTCEFHVVELDLRPPLLSKDTLKMFRGDLDQLRRERQKIAREDKIRAKQNELEHRKAHGLYPDMGISLDNTYQFPAQLTSPTQAVTAASPPAQPEACPPPPSPAQQTEPVVWGPQNPSLVHPTQSDPRSFAKMAVSGGAWGSSPPTFTHRPRWPTSDTAPSLGAVGGTTRVNSDGEEELAAPSYQSAMAEAFSSLDLNLQQALADSEAAPAKAAGGGGKKKKKKAVPLFSTTMARKS